MNLPPAIYTQLGQSIFGLTILLSVPLFYSTSDQALLFLFISLGALSRLADMGFLNLVIIYASKSFEYQNKEHLSELKLYTYKHHIRKLVTIFPFIFLIGCLVLFFRQDFMNYLIAWFLYVLAISCTFSINYFLSFHEGAFDLQFAHIFRGLYYAFSGILFLFFSYLNFSILSLGLSLVISGLLVFSILFYRGILRFDRTSGLTATSFHDEFIKLSRKTFFSWLGGYIGTHGLITASFFLINPIFSGLLGLTFNIFIFLQNLANIFLISKIPNISKLASYNAQYSLRLMLVSLKQSLAFYLLLLTFFSVFYFNLPSEYAQRLLGVENIFFIAIAFLCSISTYGFSIFVRAYKVEPFGVMSLTTAFIGVVSMTTIASFSLDYALAGFTLASCVSFVWTYLIFLKQKQLYA